MADKKRLKKIWAHAVEQLAGVYEHREAANMIQLLMEDVFGYTSADLLLDAEVAIDRDQLDQLLSRLARHEPVQYVIGFADFYTRRFRVTPDTLIPRPETEELVALILQHYKGKRCQILDVGTGTGCIAITLALETDGEVTATDVSVPALQVAAENASRLGASVTFLPHDLLKEPWRVGNLDLIVSNPPYIPHYEKAQLRKNVTIYEPPEALFVPTDDPLIFYERLGALGKAHLKRGGGLYVEVHEDFGEGVADIFTRLGFHSVVIHQDMQGKDRMVQATR